MAWIRSSSASRAGAEKISGRPSQKLCRPRLIDHGRQNGVTHKKTPEGKVGLLRDRPVLATVTSGGAMFRDPPKQPDFFRPYLNAVLGVIGLHSISYVQAIGLAFADHPWRYWFQMQFEYMERYIASVIFLILNRTTVALWT